MSNEMIVRTDNLPIENELPLVAGGNNSLQLAEALETADRMVRMQHLAVLDKLEIIPLPEAEKRISPENKVRLLHIACLTYDEKENMLDKLSGVFGAIANYDATAVFILRHDGERINLYMGTACEDPQTLSMVFGTFERAIKGNFPGCISEVKSNENNGEILSSVFDYDEEDRIAIASVSGIASRRGERAEVYLQGMEKLVDGMKGIPFDLVILASALSHETISMMRGGYETLYTQLIPFHKQNASLSMSDTESFSKTVGESISKSLSLTTGTTTGSSRTTGESTSTSTSREQATNKEKGMIIGGNVLAAAASIALKNPMFMMMGSSATQTLQTLFNAKPANETRGTSQHVDTSVNEGKSTTEGETTTDTDSTSTTEGDSRTTGKGMSYNLENRTIGNILEAIDSQINRLKLCEGNGAYQCAAYLIAADQATALMGASLYRSLLTGDDPAANVSYINVWQERPDTEMLREYVKHMIHPRFALNGGGESRMEVTPATLSPTPEISLHFAWPRKPLPGLTVATHAEFARDIISSTDSADEGVKVGKIYHLGNTENTEVTISPAELRKHLFVAGAPGSGKSNFCYVLLNRLTENGVKFMVIEPAKGEYASVFGGRADVNVFGTNSNLAPVLSINPFAFPEGVHPLEHLDRIIEVFNASWPMYAAMPALLKEALEASYIACGWNLETGVCTSVPAKFPTFKTLLEILPKILKQTEYSQEVQGNYIGSLVTRVKSMTNGICGQIFCGECVEDKVLFDQNTIIDISRLGSSETKSLIMGIMIIRLQEYRSCTRVRINQDLQHVTLLEEAHHLLRQVSGAQSMESANLRGMSVEILTNAIAEMRTYGEGFIIADQTPSIMSEAVIGNTSTKVIFKLPNIQDRAPVGNAIALNEEQIGEIAKLDTGVAVMHQSHWLNPALCKVDYYSEDQFSPLQYVPFQVTDQDITGARTTAIRLLLCKKKNTPPPSVEACGTARKILGYSHHAPDRLLSEALTRYCQGKELLEWQSFGRLSATLNAVLNGQALFDSFSVEIAEWHAKAVEFVGRQADLDKEEIQTVIAVLIVHQKDNFPESRGFYFNWIAYVEKH